MHATHLHRVRRTIFVLVVFSCALAAELTAQIERPIPYPFPADSAWDAAVAAGTRTEDGRPGAKYWTNYATYSIQARLDPATAKVTGHVDIVYRNRSPRRIGAVYLHLRQNLHKAGSLRNRFVEITGGVETSNLTVAGEVPGPRSVRVQGTVMRIRLPVNLAPDGEVTIGLDWSYQVPKAGAPRNGHDDFHVYYLGYWYPQLAVFDDVRGWVAEQYMSNSEFYMGYADYDVRFTVPQGWLVHATGSLENPGEVLTDTARERLAEAADGDEVVHVITKEDLDARRVTKTSPTGELTWHFTSENVRDVAVSVSDRYLWDATRAVVPDRDGPGKDGTCMIHAVYEEKSGAFRRAAEFARHTIEFMSRKVRPYPWPHMTACQGVIGGGMEFPMMTIIGGGGRSVHGVVTHELVHMWFPMVVGSNEKAHAFQDEGMTDYFSSVTTADFSKREDPARRSRSLYLRVAARGETAPMMRHGDRFPERGSYGFVSYAKTGAVLHQLRAMLGEEAFDRAIREYADQWAFKHPYPRDLFRTFQRVAGQPLDWYFRTWFHEVWTLDQAVAGVEPDGEDSIITIEDRGLATAPTIVRVTFDDGREASLFVPVEHWLSGRNKKELSVSGVVRKVVIDPEVRTLDLSRSNNVWERP